MQNGTGYEPNDDIQLAGSIYVASPVEMSGQEFVFGLGITNAYGLGVEWPSNVPSRNTGSGYEGRLEMPQLQFSASYKVTSKLGVGLTYNSMDGELESKSGVAPAPNNASNIFKGNGTGNFMQYGVSYEVNDEWFFGLAYRDSFKVNFEGEFSANDGALVDSEASSTLAFPSHWIVGVNYRGADKWSLSWQSQWTQWSEVEQFNLQFKNATLLALFGNQTTPVNWENGWIHSLGASYELNEKVTLRGGYMYSESIIPDATQTLTHADFAQHFLSGGVSVDYQKWGTDLTLVYVISEDQTISGNVYGINGEHEANGFFVNLGVRYRF